MTWHLTPARITILVSGLALVGCVAQPTPGETLNSWLGATETELIAAWGAPENTFDDANGSKILIYNASQTVFGAAGVNAPSASPRHKGCVTIFTIREQEIAEWNQSGNGCGKFHTRSRVMP